MTDAQSVREAAGFTRPARARRLESVSRSTRVRLRESPAFARRFDSAASSLWRIQRVRKIAKLPWLSDPGVVPPCVTGCFRQGEVRRLEHVPAEVVAGCCGDTRTR